MGRQRQGPKDVNTRGLELCRNVKLNPLDPKDLSSVAASSSISKFGCTRTNHKTWGELVWRRRAQGERRAAMELAYLCRKYTTTRGLGALKMLKSSTKKFKLIGEGRPHKYKNHIELIIKGCETLSPYPIRCVSRIRSIMWNLIDARWTHRWEIYSTGSDIILDNPT